jgi:hypothetical protein
MNFQFETAEQSISTWLKKFGGEKREFVIVGIAAVIWSIWKTRNLACFDKK